MNVSIYSNDSLSSGTVTSEPAGIDCDAVDASCSGFFRLHGNVRLNPTPDTGGSVFVGWSGDSDCTDGQVTMDSDKNCTALFVFCSPTIVTVRIFEGSYYDSIGAAYLGAGAPPYDIIQILASNQLETLDFDLDKAVILEGGYGDNYCQFTDQPFATTITGSVTITRGAVTFDQITIQ